MKLFWLLLLLVCSLKVSAVDVVIHNLDALTIKGFGLALTTSRTALHKPCFSTTREYMKATIAGASLGMLISMVLASGAEMMSRATA